MSPRSRPATAGGTAAANRRDALAQLLHALDLVLEHGVARPDARLPDASLRTCALEIAFAEAEAIFTRLANAGDLAAMVGRSDTDRLIAAAASICVWGRTPGRGSPLLDELAEALNRMPGTVTPLAQLA